MFARKGVSTLDKSFNSLRLGPKYAQLEMNSSQVANFVKAGLKTAKNTGPPVTATALGSVALTAKHAASSQTLGESLNTARHNSYHLEEFGSFDSNESSQDRLVKLQRHKSVKF